MGRLLAADIDLHRIHVWNETEGEAGVVDGTFYEFLKYARAGDTILLECASPHVYTEGVQKKRIAWMIYNSFIIGVTHGWLHTKCNLLISPSSTWTQGYDEGKRHLLTKAEDIPGLTKDQNHNIKECQAMARMYTMRPGVWQKVEDYIRCL